MKIKLTVDTNQINRHIGFFTCVALVNEKYEYRYAISKCTEIGEILECIVRDVGIEQYSEEMMNNEN